MGIVHIVQFQFKAAASYKDVQDVCRRMLELKNTCVHPTTNKPYMKSAVGGMDNSPEGLQNGLTHGFILEFESEENRNYYVKHDPAHIAFVKSIGEVVEKAQVLDFTPGRF